MKNQVIIWLMIAINVFVYFMWSSASTETQIEFMRNNFAVSWDSLLAGHWWVLLGSVFSHQLLFHLIFNMMVLSSFGPIVADSLGTRFFVIFYLIAGILSSLSHALVTAFFLHQPGLPAVGASGALAGVLFLFCFMYPREKILLMAIIPIPAIWGALTFVILDIWGLIAQSRGGGLPIGHGAHLGGALCGLIAYFYLINNNKSQNPRLK